MFPSCPRWFLTSALIFVFSLLASAQTEKVLYSFTGGADGAEPRDELVMDASGNLYGATYFGGNTTQCDYGCGVIFEISPGSGGTWTYQTLYTFSGKDGANPNGGLIFDKKGNLYGTTMQGGTFGFGTAFELEAQANGTWKEIVLYNFGKNSTAPSAHLVFDKNGNLYGVSELGGYCGNEGCGKVFRLQHSKSGSWTEKPLLNLGKVDYGNEPDGSVIRDRKGNLFGTAYFRGPCHGGGLFEVSPGPKDQWTSQLLIGFGCGGTGGINPDGTLSFDAKGNLFGVLANSGRGKAGGIFEFDRGAGKEVILHEFNGSDGANPECKPVFDSSGNFYGATSAGGSANLGVVFSMTKKSNGHWQYAVLHSFAGGSDGASPDSGVILDSSRNIFGTTVAGGSSGAGAIYEITP